MKLYIASTTKQRQIFAYREIETNRLIQISINHGDQMMALGGTTEEVDAVVQHHQVYRLVDSTKIDQSQAFVGLCYDLGKPASASITERVIHDNDICLTRGAHGRRRAPIATLDGFLRDNGIGYSGGMEVSAEQVKGREDNEDTPTVNETIVAEKTGDKKK